MQVCVHISLSTMVSYIALCFLSNLSGIPGIRQQIPTPLESSAVEESELRETNVVCQCCWFTSVFEKCCHFGGIFLLPWLSHIALRPPSWNYCPLEIIDLYKQDLSFLVFFFFFSLAGLAQKYVGVDSEPELSDLMNEVASKVSAKWKEISIQLGLTVNDQKCFIDATSGDPNQCFTFVFNVWRNRATRPYKWSTVIKALETPAVGEKRLAQDLRTKLQSQLPDALVRTEP